MGRWRPPAPASSPYITPEGYLHLETELKDLWERRKDVTRALAAAAAEGDRSENAEYIYRKKELRELDARIGYLQRRMPKLKIVRDVGDTNSVFFGAWVTIVDADGIESVYRIVGPDEIDYSMDYISIDSPMARALRSKHIDDEFSLNNGTEIRQYLITDIRYKTNPR
ncbi:MAG: Transcription elongation factor GreB [Gammaproteobacteria bacterium]|nr:Transcription elongation factor GreB [Gammaproteobacteria bacterium]